MQFMQFIKILKLFWVSTLVYAQIFWGKKKLKLMSFLIEFYKI